MGDTTKTKTATPAPVPVAMYLAAERVPKRLLLRAFWLALSKGCISDEWEAIDMALTWINAARQEDGRRKFDQIRLREQNVFSLQRNPKTEAGGRHE